eukprot:TRINITY_DN7935_c0_g1_i1.p1 TRINITY_DN7935_c0_g1~~TRINITY_DN7935_c0_g1_i1.p1  ORF type:complete len:534 (+),score=138.56 TRINITY_DN7935_c0_g1_i1:37-1638(+)
MAMLSDGKIPDELDMDYSGLGGVASVQNLLKSRSEVLVLSDHLVKINRHLKKQPRTLLITNAALYNLKGSGYSCKRRIPLDKVSSLTSSNNSGELVIHVLEEYDYRFVIEDLHKDRIIKVIRKFHKAMTGKSLKTDYVMVPELTELTWTKSKIKEDPQKTSYRQRLEELSNNLEEDKNSDLDDEQASPTAAGDETKISVRNFEMLKVIGRGAFGKVLLVKKKDTGTVYAMKILKKSAIKSGEQRDLTISERAILEAGNHPFLMSLRFAFQTNSRLYFVTDFYKGGDMFFHLRVARRFTEEQARFMLAELVLAIGHLHAMGYVYRDIKPENILFDEEGNVCLADFGLTRSAESGALKTFCGTPGFLAPEILKGQGYGKPVDWWALGVLLYEMTIGIPPFHASELNQMYHKILHGSLRFPPHLTPDCRDLIISFLNRSPEKRLGGGAGGVEDVKKHVFFNGLDWEGILQKKVQPPFRPKIDASDETSAFDKEFTNQPVDDTPGSDKLIRSGKEEWVFDGFTYVQQPSIMENEEDE